MTPIRPIPTLLAALVACQARGAFHAPPADAGSDVPADGGVAPDGPSHSAVTGRRHEICQQQPADVDVPIDLSMALIEALVPDPGPTGYRAIAGSGSVDGSFTIPDVPDGVAFLIRIDNTYYTTDRHVFDVRSERRARCAPAPSLTQDAVLVSYDLTGMTPAVQGFQLGERLVLASLAFGFYSDDGRGLPAGDTAAAGSLSWLGSFSPVPLVDAAAGDDLHVFHRRSELVRDPETQRLRTVERVIDALDVTGTTLHVGMSSIAGAFQPAAARTFSFAVDLATLDADAGGQVSFGTLTVGLFANPHGVSSGGGALLELDLSDRSHSPSSIVGVTDQPYGDPFPASWTRSLYFDYTVTRNYTAPPPGSGTPIAHHQELRELGTDPGPPLHAPSGITVNGVDFDAGGLVRYDGVAPVTVRWNPVPGATAYRVTVPYLSAQAIGTFWTTDTSLKIPAYIFTSGGFPGIYVFSTGFYSLVVDAVQSPVDLAAGHGLGEWQLSYPTNERLRLPGPIRIAGHPSGRFHFIPHCGDGAVQPDQGEECDTGGESATCNADCTVPVCGDGLRNAAAGEDCDTAGDSHSCNFNCTLLRCGDGHVNFTLEDCDDGNALDDGNGCSADCRFNNHCGDGILEDAAELCDPGPNGDSPTCNFDCTPALCGDGYTNHAAGEQCDDPFSTQDCVACKLP